MDGDADEMVHEDRQPNHGLYRLNSNQSNASIFEDVEMAHDEVCMYHLQWFNPCIV